MTEFADISSFQHGADLRVYAAAGYGRVLIKASQGLTYTYPDFPLWWQLAGILGLARGAYHFAQPSTGNAAGEADFFLATVARAGGFGPRDWVELDCESPSTPDPSTGWYMTTLANRLVARGHPGGLVYSGEWWLEPAHLTAAMLPAGYRQLHLSDYTSAPDATMPIPAGWAREQVVARQFTSTAAQPGIPGGSDRSRILIDWLEAGDMLTIDDVKAAVRSVLADIQVPGTTDWSGAVETDVAADRADYNLDAAQSAAIGWKPGDPTLAARLTQIEADLAAVRQQIATVPPGSIDLTPVTGQLDRIETFLRSLTLTVAARAA